MERFKRIAVTGLALILLISLLGGIYALGAVQQTATGLGTAQEGDGDIDVPFDPVKKVRRIWISTKPAKLKYRCGEALDTTGLAVNAAYSDGSTAAVTGYTVSGYAANTVGTQTITVTFGDKTATFEVTVYQPGDADGNGTANASDIDVLMQYAAGWGTQIDKTAADVNGDGNVDGRDAALLAQYLAGWNVTIE